MSAIKLIIQVPLEWMDRPEITELINNGHTVIPADPSVDLVLGPKAHYFVEEMFEEWYLELAIKRARKGRKEREG